MKGFDISKEYVVQLGWDGCKVAVINVNLPSSPDFDRAIR